MKPKKISKNTTPRRVRQMTFICKDVAEKIKSTAKEQDRTPCWVASRMLEKTAA